MGIKNFVQKQLFGYSQNDVARTMADLVNANMFKFLGNDTQIQISDNFDYIRNGFMENPHMYEAITLVTNKISSCPKLIYEIKSQTKLKEYDNLMKSGVISSMAKAVAMKADAIQEVDVPRIRQLLNNPNEKQSEDEFTRLISVLLLATGNALAYGVSGDARSKKLSEIWALPFQPNDFSIISGGMFEPVKSYRVKYNDGNELDFDADDIAHFKTVNPLFELTAGKLYGMAPMHAYRRKLVRAKLGDDSVNKLLKNGFRIALISPKHKEDQLGSEQKKGLKESILEALNSNASYQRFIPSSIPMEHTPIGLDSTELGIIDLDQADRESVYRGYSIPMTYASNDGGTYNNKIQSGRDLIYNAVAPYCELIGDILTKFICEPFLKADGKRYIIRLDYMSLPELASDMAEMVKWLKDMPISVNEFREAAGYGKSEEPGSDAILMNRGKVTLSQVVSGETLRSTSTEPPAETQQ